MRDIEPDEGAERTTTWYAWLPVTIGRETRWLEYVTVRQIYGAGSFRRKWFDIAFVDGDEDKS